MYLLRTHGWRLALVASGALAMVAGPMHPDADPEDSLREELAHMVADDRWVLGHSLMVVSALLLATGLWSAYRTAAWPTRARRALLVAAVAVSLYTVETVFHLAAFLDHDHLHSGAPAPVAFTHIGLAVVLYPVSGIALAALALSLGRSWGGWRLLLAVPGVLGGLVHAASVPSTLLWPTTELSVMFASAGMLLALWSVLTGVLGRQEPATASAPAAPAPAATERSLA